VRRTLGAALLAIALTTTGCGTGVGWTAADHAEGTDLSSRYPPVAERAEDLTARTAAIALLLFCGWLPADVRLRGAGSTTQGGALLTAAGFTATLVVAWVVAAAT
jgi:hypothetical protein